MTDLGTPGEIEVHRYFDSEIGEEVTFPVAKTKNNAQAADVLVWLNRVVLLVEVKTRVSSTQPLRLWAETRIRESAAQIQRAYSRCESGESVFVRNRHYHVELDPDEVHSYSGLIVLNYEGISSALPTDAVPSLYSLPIPVQVLSVGDLRALRGEIDTLPDLLYYLRDRFRYARRYDIPLDCERNVLACYKMNINKFPDEREEFSSGSHWQLYSRRFGLVLARRAEHNRKADLIEELRLAFDHKKLRGGIPLGLWFAWEFAAMSRRERAIVGEKLHGSKERFLRGGDRRYFSFQNPSSRNWLVFYFSNAEEQEIRDATRRWTMAKLIKEVAHHEFDQAVFGFGFRVSRTLPIRLEGLQQAIVLGAGVAQFTQSDYESAIGIWGDETAKRSMRVLEFPA